MIPSKLREWNPVVLLEARQLTRNRFFMTAAQLYLLIILVAVVWVGVERLPSAALSMNGGAILFESLYKFIALIMLVFVPLFVGGRMVADREQLPLLFVTTIKTSAIMRGRFFNAFTMVLLFIMLCLPFMIFSVSLRGVDVLTIVRSLGLLACYTLFCCEVLLLIACLPISRIFQLLFGLAVHAFMLLIAVVVSGEIKFYVSSFILDGFITWLLYLLVMTGSVIHQACVVFLKPRTANCALPFRVWCTGWLLVSIFVAGIIMDPDDEGLALMFMIWLALQIFLPFVLGEAVQISRRVRQSIPRNKVGRSIAFLFFSGAAGGVLWLFLSLAACILGIRIMDSLIFDHSMGAFLFIGPLYVGWYGQLAVLFQEHYAKNSKQFTWVFVVVIALLFSFLPIIITFLVSPANFGSTASWEVGVCSYICAFIAGVGDDNMVYHFVFVILALFFTSVINGRWWMKQFMAFKRLEEIE